MKLPHPPRPRYTLVISRKLRGFRDGVGLNFNLCLLAKGRAQGALGCPATTCHSSRSLRGSRIIGVDALNIGLSPPPGLRRRGERGITSAAIASQPHPTPKASLSR